MVLVLEKAYLIQICCSYSEFQWYKDRAVGIYNLSTPKL